MTTRRSFLATMAALGGGLSPLGRCLGAAARQSEAGRRPMRFVFFLQGNGFYPDEIQPEGIALPLEPTALEDRALAGHTLPRAIDPLTPYIDRMAMVHGLSGRVTGPPPHSADFGALGCYPQRKGAFAETVDAALAKAFPGIFEHVGLGICDIPDASVIYNVSARGPGKYLPTQCQPLLAYQRLFASIANPGARAAFDAKTNILDFLAQDVRRLSTQLNAAEKAKLDYYLQALETMGHRQDRLAAAVVAAAGQRRIPVSESLPPGTGGFKHLQAQFSIAAGALIAGLTNVVTVSSGGGLGFTGIQVDGAELGFAPGAINLHGVGHGTGFCGQDWKTLHIALHHHNAQALAGFLQQLHAVPEGDGTMLDNTLVIYMSDMAEKHHPRCFEWPFILIGDLGGRLKTRGRYLRYPWYRKSGHRTMANLYTTLLHAAGAPRDRFGLADTSLADFDQDGPLQELLV
ncbi:MAG: DUF1552 domain-containing protein [Xanthomonadales bacterium]|nr:DUF1552 domain-containing protein [Xanthomonadales bacterium]